MANQYTNINWSQPISSYVPMPLDLLYKIGAHKQANYDKVEEDRLDLLGKQWNRLSADAERANQIKSEVNSTLEEFANKDFNNPAVKSEWYKKKRELADRFGPMGDIGAMEANYKLHQDYIKSLDEQRKKGPKEGGIDLDTYNKLRDISLQNYKGIGVDEGRGYNQFSGVQPAGYVDLAKQADDLAKGWKENKKASEGWSEDPSGKLYRKRGSKVEWIDEKEIYNNIMPQLMNDPMNQAFVQQDILLNTYNMSPKEKEELDLDKTNLSYFDRAAKYAANKYGFKSTEYTSDIQNTPWAKDMYHNDIANLGTSTQSEALSNADMQKNPIESSMEFDSKGNLKVPTKAGWVNKPGHDEGSIYDPNKVVYNNDKSKDLNKLASQVAYIKQIQDSHPELKGLTPKKTIDTYNKALKSVHSESIPLKGISGLAAKDIGMKLARDLNQRNMYIWDSEGKTTDGTRETVLKELGIDQKEFQDQLEKGIAGYTQAGPIAGAYYVNIIGDNNKSRRVLISPDEEMKTIFQTSHMVNEARKTMNPFEIQSVAGYKVLGKPNISKEGNVRWDYVEVFPDGTKKPTTLDQIRKEEREALKESKYLGSQIEDTKDEQKDID